MGELLASFEFAAPAELPTPNTRWHWSKRQRVTREIRAVAAQVALSERHKLRLPACGKERRHVLLTLVRGPSERALDRDNLAAGLKPVLDALGPPRPGAKPAPGASWLHDDREEFVDVDYDQLSGPRALVRVAVSTW